MKQQGKAHYSAPEVKVVSFNIERGFGGSYQVSTSTLEGDFLYDASQQKTSSTEGGTGWLTEDADGFFF